MSVEQRLEQLEEKLKYLEIEMGKLALELEHNEDLAMQRFEALSTSQIEIKDLLKARAELDEKRAQEARDYRARREELEAAEKAAHKAWVRSLVNPQTIVIIAAIVASMLGLQAAEFGHVMTLPAAETP